MEQSKQFTSNKSKKGAVISLEKGKLPPQAIELEQAVLGAMMIDKKGVDDVIDILSPDTFYKPEHQVIYNAIYGLFKDSQPIDLLTVSDRLIKDGNLQQAGGDLYLINLTQKVSSSAHIEFHARIVLQKFIQRKLISISNDIIQEAYDETTDVFDLLDSAEAKLFEVSQGSLKRSSETAEGLVAQALKKIEEIAKTEGMSGVPSGFTKLDGLTSGWQPSDLVILAARPGMGKCLGKGTKVLLFNGTLKNVEDIEVGEKLMGDDSTPRIVKSIARGQEQMYWIRQNKAIDYRVNESHILSLVRSRNEGKHKKGDILNITVKDYFAKSDKFKSNYKGYKVAVDFEGKEIPIAPYFLGLWLGDGHSFSSRITTTDKEIINYLKELSIEYDQVLQVYTQKDKVNNYAITKGYRGGNHNSFSIQSELNKLDLIKNKHIPQDFLINSKQNRLELLAGLIDSDGHYDDKANCYEIVQKNKKLATQIKFLCDSLGYRTTLKEKKAKISKIGFESTVYRLRFYGNINEVPVKINYKKARIRKAITDWKVTGIHVDKDIVDNYYGFEIDGNRLFLLEDMTVTHNTAFVMSMAKNMAIDFDIPVAIFSLEMSSVQLITRMISSETGISSGKLKKGALEPHEWQQLNIKVKKLADAPIFIDDTPSLSIFDLRAKARRLASQHGVKIVIIDYLQLMTAGGNGKNGNREQEISTISRNLKALAKELNIPVIALSQLSRAVETRGGSKRPMLSDLRESGAIEQDADIVSFIFRPEYYGSTEWDDDDHTPCEGQAELIIAKHRNGGLENIRLKFTGHLAQFSDLEDTSFDTIYTSKMNSGLDTTSLPSAQDVFGETEGEDDVPF